MGAVCGIPARGPSRRNGAFRRPEHRAFLRRNDCCPVLASTGVRIGDVGEGTRVFALGNDALSGSRQPTGATCIETRPPPERLRGRHAMIVSYRPGCCCGGNCFFISSTRRRTFSNARAGSISNR